MNTGTTLFRSVRCFIPAAAGSPAIFILQDTRKLHAAYHTAGHYLSQLVLENIALPLNPVRGDHTPGKAYVEFEGDTACINPDTIDHLRMAMLIERQARLKVKAALVMPGSKEWETALVPKNFKPPVNKPLRLVQIENYRPIPCGGTHLDALNGFSTISLKAFVIKGSKAILGYECAIDTSTIV
jgi:alanyl-tRNA synthetase